MLVREQRCRVPGPRADAAGHARAALIKVCLAFEHGVLPANLHYAQPNPNNASLNAGVLKVRAPGGTLRGIQGRVGQQGLGSPCAIGGRHL